jgi:hypothetical protein
MGKIFSQFSTTYEGPVYHGMKSSMIRNIIDALPGDTYILKMDALSCGTIVRLEMVNSLFNDNTEITAKYSVKRTTLPNGFIFDSDIFDGIDIIDPPSANTVNPCTTIPLPSVTFTTPNTGSGHTLTVPAGFSIDIDKMIYNSKSATSPKSCTCGAGSVGGTHSGWCDIGGLNP